MNRIVVNANPYTIAPTGDPANYAENELCIVGSGAGTVVLPLISSLRAGSSQIFIQASGGIVTITAQGGNNIVDDGHTGRPTVADGSVKIATAIGLTTWFVR